MKNIIITGGFSGIGYATAQIFSNNGYKVHILDHKTPVSSQKDQNIIYYSCDVRDFESVQKSVLAIAKENAIHSLFVNAGVHFSGSIEETNLEDFENVLGVNLRGTYYVLKEVLPLMRKQNFGSVVLTGSDQSLIGKKKSFIYGATKSAIAQMTKSLALDYAPYQIRVNCVCPGAIQTPLYDQAIQNFAKKNQIQNTEELEKQVREKHPLGRIGTPKEVGELVYFLCSEKASFITGSIVSVDGGYVAQ